MTNRVSFSWPEPRRRPSELRRVVRSLANRANKVRAMVKAQDWTSRSMKSRMATIADMLDQLADDIDDHARKK